MTRTNFSHLSNNPFENTAAPHNPFAPPSPESNTSQGYALIASGPAVDPKEVENPAHHGVEISIGWGTTLLDVTHLAAPRTFLVGDEAQCDYQLPSSKIGANSAPLLFVEQGQTFAVILPHAQGWAEIPGKGRLSLDDLRLPEFARPCPILPGASMILLPTAARIRQELGDIVLSVASITVGKRIERKLLGAASMTGLLFSGLSLLVHASLLGGMAFFHPSISGMEDPEDRAAQEVLMMQMLKASAEKEQQKVEEETTSPEEGSSSGEGAAAKGTSGKMGSTLSTKMGNKFAVKGRRDNPDPHISREQAREEASRFGMIGLLQAVAGGDSNAPTAPWGRESAEGRDEFSAMGNMWGASLGESHGNGGLGLSGIGIGGDGRYEGIGNGTVGTIFGGSGTCKAGERCDGNGTSHGIVKGTHHSKSPVTRLSTPTISGRIAPEVIQRIVRQSFGRFRLCYENGLRNNPNLAGRVSVRFIIDRSGRVSSTANAGSDLPDSAVVSCVVRSFSGMSFPEPENGIVSVTYPISFSPGSGN